MSLNRRQFTKAALLVGASRIIQPAALFAEEAEVTHIVKRGDTLGGIAVQYGRSVAAIRQANGLNGELIRIGQRLTIPSLADTAEEEKATAYTVVAGDTLGAIAIRYGVSVSRLKQANGLRGDVIRIGQTLQIPARSIPSQDFLAKVREETAKIDVRADNWKRIVAHHSGLKYGNLKKYDAAHRRRGMQNGMAYHFLIGNGIDSGDGEIEIGPRWHKQLLGGHVKSYRINLTAIGICLVGNFELTHPSRRQLDAFTQLMDWLRGEVLPKARRFAGHRELRGEQTICPGKNFPLPAMHERYPD